MLLIRNRLRWINNNIHQPKFVCEDANVTEDLTKQSLVGDYGARYDLTKTQVHMFIKYIRRLFKFQMTFLN